MSFISRGAGIATGILFRKAGLAVDAGPRAMHARLPHSVFLTHTHRDHCGGFKNHNNLNHRLYLPRGSTVPDYLKPYERVEVEPGQILRAPLSTTCREDTLEVKVHACDHRTPSVGYGIKPEFGASVAVMGDTTKKVFDLNDLSEYDILAIECTTLYKKSRESARSSGHMHYEDLLPYIEQNPSQNIIVHHFSRHYSVEDIHTFFEPFPNVTPVYPIVDAFEHARK